VSQLAEDKQEYFDPKLAEDGFSVAEAESLGWVVDYYHASKHFPGRGLVEVQSRLTDEGRYGVLLAVYEEELREHQKARARARDLFGRLVRAERQKLQANGDAAKAIKYTTEALRIEAELGAFGLLELPEEYVAELRESKPLDAARKERV